MTGGGSGWRNGAYSWETTLRMHQVQRELMAGDLKWFENAIVCNYCGVPFSWRGGRQLDHIVPVTFGGSESPANLIRCCARCNQKKGSWSALHLLTELEWDRWYRYPVDAKGMTDDGLLKVVRIPASEQVISQRRWTQLLPIVRQRVLCAEERYQQELGESGVSNQRQS